MRVRVDRGVRRHERAEQVLVRLAGKQAERGDKRMAQRQVRVNARERAERRRRVEQCFRKARHVARLVTELRCLLQEEPVLDDWPAELDPRRVPAEADHIHRRPAMRAERRIDVVDRHLPFVASALRLNDDHARRESPELDGIRIRKHRHRLDGIGGQRDLGEACRGIRQRVRTELHAGLARTPASNADAVWRLEDAREQPERRFHSAARRKLIDLLAADRLGWRHCALARDDRVGGHDFHGRGDAFDRQIDGDVRRPAGDDLGGHRRRDERGERCGHFVFARLQADDVEVAVLSGENFSHWLVRAVLDDDVRARQANRTLRRDRALDDAGLWSLGPLRASERGRQREQQQRRNDKAHRS